MTEVPALHLAEIADMQGPLPERAQAMLHELGRHVPFDASWMAMADPLSARQRNVERAPRVPACAWATVRTGEPGKSSGCRGNPGTGRHRPPPVTTVAPSASPTSRPNAASDGRRSSARATRGRSRPRRSPCSGVNEAGSSLSRVTNPRWRPSSAKTPTATPFR
jgi:hypothetical protein